MKQMVRVIIFATYSLAMLGIPDLADAGENSLDRWLGLWCSGSDEIGIFSRTALGHNAEGETGSLYLYLHHPISDADSYTLQGFTSPAGDRFVLTDGECRIDAKRDGGHLVVTDNGSPCAKISGSFQSRRFDRLRTHFVFGGPWHSKPHCPQLTTRQ